MALWTAYSEPGVAQTQPSEGSTPDPGPRLTSWDSQTAGQL